jgi:Zn-dependent protease
VSKKEPKKLNNQVEEGHSMKKKDIKKLNGQTLTSSIVIWVMSLLVVTAGMLSSIFQEGGEITHVDSSWMTIILMVLGVSWFIVFAIITCVNMLIQKEKKMRLSSKLKSIALADIAGYLLYVTGASLVGYTDEGFLYAFKSYALIGIPVIVLMLVHLLLTNIHSK